MQKKVAQLTSDTELAQIEANHLRHIISMDTLLLNDRYDLALAETNDLLGSVKDSALIELLANHEDVILLMQKHWNNSQQQPSLPSFPSSELTLKRPVAMQDPIENEDSLMAMQDKLDSMAFALQKAKVFADKLQVQVDENTAGNYLSFKSRKGNSVYYVGDIKDGKANGTGVGLLSTGSRYEGQWMNNQKHGKGIFQWQDGALYDGEYRDDLRHGTGTYHWPNGEKFVGEWEKDVRSGDGTFYGTDGKMVATGLWRDDELVKRKKKK